MPSQPTPLNITVVDDHSLFRKGLINLIHQIDDRFKVVNEACHGKEFLAQINDGDVVPDVVIMDVSMPIMDGFQTTKALREINKKIGILALTMKDDETSLIRLLKAGVNGYLNKDVNPDELREALHSIADNGYYYTEEVAGKLVNVITHPELATNEGVSLTDQEMRFIELACSEHTYKMIADIMCLSVKTVDGYRAKLFDKLDVKSRVGLVLYALKHNLVALE